MAYMNRAIAGEAPFRSVLLWLIIVPFIILKLVFPLLFGWVAAAVEDSVFVDIYRVYQIVTSLYFLFASYCLWKCVTKLSPRYSEYGAPAKAGVIAMGLWLVFSPVIGLFYTSDEQSLARFKQTDNAEALAYFTSNNSAEDLGRLEPSAGHEQTFFEIVKEKMGLYEEAMSAPGDGSSE